MPSARTRAMRSMQGTDSALTPRTRRLVEQSDQKTEVIVIGAGASGLAAARALRERGVRVEAARGARSHWRTIFTHRDPRAPAPIELGAEFVHGSAPEVMAIVREAGLLAVDIPENRWEHRGRRRMPSQRFLGAARAHHEPHERGPRSRSLLPRISRDVARRTQVRARSHARARVRRRNFTPRTRCASASARSRRAGARRATRRSSAWAACSMATITCPGGSRASRTTRRSPAHRREAHRVGAGRSARRDIEGELRRRRQRSSRCPWACCRRAPAMRAR